MSKQSKRRHQCLRKRRFADPTIATHAAYVANLRNDAQGTNGTKVEPYRCGWCGKWHIGHPPNDPKKKRWGMGIQQPKRSRR